MNFLAHQGLCPYERMLLAIFPIVFQRPSPAFTVVSGVPGVEREGATSTVELLMSYLHYCLHLVRL